MVQRYPVGVQAYLGHDTSSGRPRLSGSDGGNYKSGDQTYWKDQFGSGSETRETTGMAQETRYGSKRCGFARRPSGSTRFRRAAVMLSHRYSQIEDSR